MVHWLCKGLLESSTPPVCVCAGWQLLGACSCASSPVSEESTSHLDWMQDGTWRHPMDAPKGSACTRAACTGTCLEATASSRFMDSAKHELACWAGCSCSAVHELRTMAERLHACCAHCSRSD